MGGGSLPPGFRFHPTDEELVGYYLKRKMEGLQIELEVIPVIDFYKYDPWELPDKSFLPKRDMQWFFFYSQDRKYPNGSRTNRTTKGGYWKATGKDRKIVCQFTEFTVIGYRKTLVFYGGRAPVGNRTEWIMHEYRLCDGPVEGSPSFQGAFALCRIVKKNESTQKRSNCLREAKGKGVRCSSSDRDLTSMINLNKPLSTSGDISSQASYECNESHFSSPKTSPHEVESSLVVTGPVNFEVSCNLILDSSMENPQVQDTMFEDILQHDFSSSMTQWMANEHREVSPTPTYSNYKGEIELTGDPNQFSCMSPYSRHGNYIGFFENEDMYCEGYETGNQVPICRQDSEDECIGGLWLQEDDMMIVM